MPGTEITPEQLEYVQRLVDSIQRDFDDAVRTGRKLHEAAVKMIAPGGVFGADLAKRIGLIDEIGTLDSVYRSLGLVIDDAPTYRDGLPTAKQQAEVVTPKRPAWTGRDRGVSLGPVQR